MPWVRWVLKVLVQRVRVPRVLTVLGSLVVLGLPGAAQEQTSVKDVVRRVGSYVERFGEQASILVATEHFKQEATRSSSTTRLQRVIVADVAIVRIPQIGWHGFRDVIEVDGRPLPDRQDRLIRNLLEGGAGGFAEARRLSDESARFNIGAIERNFNVPTTALFFFKPDNLERFSVKTRTVERDGAWHLSWRETYRPTLIRTANGTSVPAEGDLWVQPSDGTVVRTILKTTMDLGKAQRGAGEMDVTYALVEPLGLWLPASMREQWEMNAPGGAWARVGGHATYSKYRQFTTSVRIK